MTADVYERSAEECLARWRRRHPRRPPLLTKWLAHLPARARLLDLGCGGGFDASDLQQRGYRVIGLDRSMALLMFGRRRHHRLSLVCADFRQVPFQAASFDGLWAAASLMHLPKSAAKQALVEWRQLVGPGAVLGATVTHGAKSRLVMRGWVPGRYFARWTKDEFARTVQRAGWRLLELRVVCNRERKGRWLNLLARAES